MLKLDATKGTTMKVINSTSNKSNDNVMLLEMEIEIAKKRKNKGMALVQSSIKSQNTLLPFQSSWGHDKWRSTIKKLC